MADARGTRFACVLNAAETSFFVYRSILPPTTAIFDLWTAMFYTPRLLGPPSHTATHGRFAPGNLLPVFSLLCELVCFQNSLQRVVIKYSRGFSSFLLLLLLFRIHDYFCLFVCYVVAFFQSLSFFLSPSFLFVRAFCDSVRLFVVRLFDFMLLFCFIS